LREQTNETKSSSPPDSGLIGFESTPKSNRHLVMIVWACSIFGLLAVLQYLEPPNRSLAWISVFDAGHVPLFGAIALAVFQFLLATPLANRSRPLLYALALVITILIGEFSEWLQIGTDRNSDPRDVVNDAIGACSFLLLAATRDPHALSKSSIGSKLRTTCRIIALGLLVIAFAPTAQVARAYAQRAAAFPALCDFAGTWETRFVTTSYAHLEYTSLRDESGRVIPVAHVQFEPVRTAAFTLLEPYPDWKGHSADGTGHQRLRVVARSELDRPVDLVLRIHDRRHDGRPSDRFSRRLSFLPGLNAFSIPLAEIQAAPEGRELDLSAIRRLSLFTSGQGQEEGFSLDLLELRLD